MKTRFLSLIAVIIIIFSLFIVTANAEKIEKFNIEYSLSKEFIVLTEENTASNENAIKSLGFTKESFKDYISANNIVLFASLPDKSCQITVNVNKTEFSEKSEDLDYLDDSYIAQIRSKIVNKKIDSNKIYIINSTKYILIENLGKDNAGEFSSLQFVTIKNKRLYTVTISFNNEELTEENTMLAENLMKGFIISAQKEKVNIKSFQNITVKIILILFIIFLAALVIYFVATLISDFLKNRNTSDVAPYVKIKRRRFK